ncbi:hypothetical protein Kpol_1054p32 [Vanderwaltozyma polyspora DSM 70294]|uniref:DOD-type homing endonuclease domain-containing protein n=1 Tax=Vanderwaltozyma polyspora (strain ATCC 22028 / DSM 70294 / BCRC 21397 / CBS 2163 / NBRC 10782 / NRRL Y-8283 / UCD 57-17) TaxID=436907 RepID=A7TIB9_VANPO|nr:uncharacterized protein Kpol_1054p32 [Vanderwaltozyma polyspora DSM 70294]EDO17985.1 hypothetical protein Kpol_1054p32 [Vanderwaltozyma polyspora DSM 70294]
MFEEGTRIIMADGTSKDISEIIPNDFIMCEDGSAAKVTEVSQDNQTTYQIVHNTKHRANEGDAARKDPLRKEIYQRLELNCTVAHELSLRTPATVNLENSFRTNHYKVRWRNLEETLTVDGRMICIPKNHHKDFPMTPEGELSARAFMAEMEAENGEYFEFNLQVRDLDLLSPQIRVTSFLHFNPIIKGNGILSEFLTGEKHLITTGVLQMAWLLGLWIGDGTTKEPEITVDSHDTELMKGLHECGKTWGLYPTYKDEKIPLRAKHVRLYYGKEAPENRKYRHFRKHNPFWNAVTCLKFKRDGDGAKQIPTFMWSEDVEVREAFMAGLIDADGYVVKRKEGPDSFKVAIQTIYPSIMNGVINISRSLGINATVTTRSAKPSIIAGRKVNCQFTFDCNIAGRAPLQSILSYCTSGHKRRDRPVLIAREPSYFGFLEEKRDKHEVYGIKINSHKSILLENKMAVPVCGSHCEKEQPKLTTTKNLKHCIACPRKGVRYFYKDWTGNHRVCGRCYGRYKFSGYRCLNCKYVPEAREVKKAKAIGEGTGITPEGVPVKGYCCIRCNGILTFDAVRGPKKLTEAISNT